jgi:hypothetical protein
MEKQNKSITFGIIALVLAIFSVSLPKFYITIPIILGLIFSFIGILKDGKKWAAIIALFILVLFGAMDLMDQSKTAEAKEKTYQITYKVSGASFDVGYNNATGGMDHEKGRNYWEKKVTLKGTDFAYITGQNTEGSKRVTVNIYIDEVLIKTATSSGEYSIADANCYPYKQ